MKFFLVAFSVLLASACTGNGDETTPVPQSQDARTSNTPSLAGSPEPTPYQVPALPATDRLEVVAPVPAFSTSPGETTVPWELIRLYDGGRSIGISYSFGCNEPGRVEVVESESAVAVRVLRPPPGRGPYAACLSSYRKAIALRSPLGSRTLLHAS